MKSYWHDHCIQEAVLKFIPIDKIEHAWINFVENGHLEQKDHIAATYRSSFILMLFSQLPFVKVDEGPPLLIKLELIIQNPLL